MNWDFINNYLIILNVASFILFTINTLLYKYTEKGQIDTLLTIVSLLGGAFGIVLAILIMDRKPAKENMMSRVFVICVLIVQIIIFLFLNGVHGQSITFAFNDFFVENRLFVIYLLVLNIATFITFGLDKYKAIKKRPRIRIVTLLVLAFLGGTIGGLLAMYLFRHKTQKDYFTVGMPMILVTQILLIFYVMNL